jgi:hypothetical protein
MDRFRNSHSTIKSKVACGTCGSGIVNGYHSQRVEELPPGYVRRALQGESRGGVVGVLKMASLVELLK